MHELEIFCLENLLRVSVAMQFLKTLFPSFFMWQFFSLSPFILTKDSLMPKLSQNHNVICALSLGVQSAVMVFGLCNFKHYIPFDNRPPIKAFGDIFSMNLIRASCILTVVESWIKRLLQIQFLEKIDEIDTIFNRKLEIDLNYGFQRKKSFQRFILLIGYYLCLQMIMLVVTFDPALSDFEIFCALYAVPLFVCTLRYQQFISYVYLLNDRFKALNKYIKDIAVRKATRGAGQMDKFSHFVYVRSFYIGQDNDLEALLILNKIKHIRRIYRVLINANCILCRLFNWSMLIIVFNDFCNILINIYWIIMNLLNQGPKLELFSVSAWAIFNVSMLLSLSKACNFTCIEVIFQINRTILFALYSFENCYILNRAIKCQPYCIQ